MYKAFPQFLATALGACLWIEASTAHAAMVPVTVGANGVSPLIASAPDGSLYAAARQNVYRSLDLGGSWQPLDGPDSLTSRVATESAIAVDATGRVYLAFNYLGGLSTALCTSVDRGNTWNCDPMVVSGGVSQPWLVARSAAAFLATTPAVGQAAFLASPTSSLSWRATTFLDAQVGPATGPLMASPVGSHVLQASKWHDPSGVDAVAVHVFAPGAGVLDSAALTATRTTPLPHPNGVPSGAFDAAGALYLVSEADNDAAGQQLVVVRSADEGVSWVTLPSLPGGDSGTATLAWLTAGAAGHVGVLYYFSPQSGSASSLPDSATWAVMWAESTDAATAYPHWNVSTVERIGHLGAICGSCVGEAHFAGDFLSAKFDDVGNAYLAWVAEDSLHSTTVRHAVSVLATPAPAPAPRTEPSRGGGALNPALLLPLMLLALARRRRFAPQ